MFTGLIPFIFLSNLYGNIMIKAEYFQTDYQSNDVDHSVINKILDPLTKQTKRDENSIIQPKMPHEVDEEYSYNDNKFKCNLDYWYQMMSILYMLLIYCQIVVFYIFACSAISYMKRFFLIVDDIPFERQRRLRATLGGRIHPLLRRSFDEYMHAFNYSYYIQSRVRINRSAELRYLLSYKNKVKEEQIRNRIKSVVYKSSIKLEDNL